MEGDAEGYPGKDEVAKYLERYAGHFGLPVLLETGIRSLTRLEAGFRARTDAGEIIDARAVVLATEAFRRPAVPAISRQLSPEVVQLTPDSYKRPSQVPPGRVLVVGDGARGRRRRPPRGPDRRAPGPPAGGADQSAGAYRGALGADAALRELERNAGTQFCPRAVEALLGR